MPGIKLETTSITLGFPPAQPTKWINDKLDGVHAWVDLLQTPSWAAGSTTALAAPFCATFILALVKWGHVFDIPDSSIPGVVYARGMKAMGPWTKSSITAFVAALSAYFGTLFVSHQAAKSNGEHIITMEYVGIIVFTSIVFWLYAAYNMRNHLPGILPALLLGAASPFIGGFVAGLPFLGVGSLYGVYLAMNSYHLMVPIGVVTGIAVWYINRGVQPTAGTNDVFDSDRLP